jgi:hypothetical protein
MTAVSTLTKGAIMLTQGFHQPEDFSVLPPGEIPVLNMIVYPNPAATTVKIQFDMLSNNAVTLFIINTSGQLVYQQTNPYAAGRVLITLAVNHFAPGIYTVMLRAGGHAFQEKLVIQ